MLGRTSAARRTGPSTRAAGPRSCGDSEGIGVCRDFAHLAIALCRDDPVFAARAIEAGAKGYIAKNDDPLLLAEAVRRVAEGGSYLHPDMAREIAFLRVGSNASRISDLSARELEILRLLAKGKTMAEIADVLRISYKTVANNCTHLRQKLGARSAMDLMRIAIDSHLG